MLTLPEEFLLLTMTDEVGDFMRLPAAFSASGFVGAALMDLALRTKIDSDLERIWIVDPAPTDEPCLDLILRRLAAPGFDFDTAKIVGQLADTGARLRELALARLCERKILAKVEDRLFWVFKLRCYPLIDNVEIREVKTRLNAVLLGGELPDPRDVCLLALVQVCGLSELVVPKSEVERARKRLAAVARMDIIGQRVAGYIKTWLREVSMSHGVVPSA